MSRRFAGILFALPFLLPLPGLAQGDVPALQGRVNDYANLMSPGQKQRIEAQLAQFEQQTGNQVAVLTTPTLNGEDIEGYGNRVARAWALGQKGKDNGALLIVASQDRKMRIEVGYGLEPVLTDLQTSIIQNEVIIPYFKRGDFGGGIEAGVSAMLSTIQGKAVEPAPVQDPAGGRGRGGGDWPGFLIFGLFALGPFVLNAIRSGSWVVYIVLLPVLFFLGSIISIPLGLIAAGAWLVLFPILRMILPRTPRRGRRGGGGWWIGPGFGGGGWGGGRGGGWGGGGGGFSGGGGSFGGGGSSSSW
ncbi:MAG TPA: TPM domain-containing protein [Thermoanaerobaculia bacterium]|jgi:uncharacterized protein|nr:TPM domain-containing protein [Thermoanaerobaculia bacterium]